MRFTRVLVKGWSSGDGLRDRPLIVSFTKDMVSLLRLSGKTGLVRKIRRQNFACTSAALYTRHKPRETRAMVQVRPQIATLGSSNCQAGVTETASLSISVRENNYRHSMAHDLQANSIQVSRRRYRDLEAVQAVP